MRLEQLTINNFGIYRNENTFTFPYSEERRVSIVIGKNGSGKTTFLNAIKICLFGPMILKNRTITKSYEDFIRNKLNKEAIKEAVPCFGIKATFISRVHNYDGKFTIERTWDISNNFKENVYIQRTGKPLSEEDQTAFFNAFYHTYPLDLFELFYLDGEKIDQLSVLNSNIFNLIESSINVDLFKKLKNDLLTYASKRVNSKEIKTIKLKKDTLESQIKTHIDTINDNYHENELLRKEIDQKADEIQNIRDSLHIHTITIDSAEIKVTEQSIYDLKRSIEEDLTKFLPYTLVVNQLQILLSNIMTEFDQNKNSIITNALSSTELQTHLRSMNLLAQSNPLIKAICDFYPTDNLSLIHRLSNDDFYSLKSKIDSLLTFNKESLHNKMKELSKLEKKYSKLTSNAAEVEALEAAGQLDNLLELQKEQDSYTLQLKSNEELIHEFESDLENFEKELKNVENELWKQLKKSNITNILEQIHIVLDQYISQIKTNKVKEIELHTKEMFDRLIRKEGFINDFKIENDMIYLMDRHDNKLNHLNLSAGEKQLFVLSLLYAVLQSSERLVPLMFDTLLGRLDAGHRDKVFKEFISSCPDQVIILATDSELANISHDYLSAITNIAYSIDFSDSDNPMSEVQL